MTVLVSAAGLSSCTTVSREARTVLCAFLAMNYLVWRNDSSRCLLVCLTPSCRCRWYLHGCWFDDEISDMVLCAGTNTPCCHQQVLVRLVLLRRWSCKGLQSRYYTMSCALQTDDLPDALLSLCCFPELHTLFDTAELRACIGACVNIV